MPFRAVRSVLSHHDTGLATVAPAALALASLQAEDAAAAGLASQCGSRENLYQGSSNSPSFAPATNASHSDSVNTNTVSSGPVNFEFRIAM